MSTSISQIRDQMSQILMLRDKFTESAIQSDEKLANMIEVARKFHTGMKPLNENVEHLQNRIKNIECCISGLSHVQDFYKTGEEVKRVIYEGPQHSLDDYLNAMDRIRDSLTYFDQNDTQHVEYSHLSALFSNGLKTLQKYLDEILQSTFSPLPSDKLYQLMLNKSALSVKQNQEHPFSHLEDIPPQPVEKLQRLSAWLRKINSSSLTDQRFQMTGASILPDSLNRYCDFRRELMRISLKKLSDYKTNIEKNPQFDQTRVTSKGSDLGIQARKHTLVKPIGVIRDATAVRGVGDQRQEVDGFDVEQYITKLSAFFLLIEHERDLLQSLKLALNSHEVQLAHEAICKGAANELLSDGSLLVRLVNKGTSRGEFNIVLAILTVFKFFVDTAKNIVSVLKAVLALSQPFNDLVNRLRFQSKQTLDYFIQQLSPNVGSSLVPPDSTVHELASLALLFLEKLMDFEAIVDIVLIWDDRAADASLDYLVSLERTDFEKITAFGTYIFKVVAAIIVYVDKKSETYPEDLQRLVFQMNNLRYVLKSLQSTGLQVILSNYDSTAVGKFSTLLEERKLFYIRRVADVLNLSSSDGTPRPKSSSFSASLSYVLSPRPGPVKGQSSRRESSVDAARTLFSSFQHDGKIDSRERAQLKEIWSNFNGSFSSFIKQHSQLSIPDKELRENLCVSICSELVPAYRSFRDVSMSIAFTSRREKYIKFTPEDFRARLEQLYASGAASVS